MPRNSWKKYFTKEESIIYPDVYTCGSGLPSESCTCVVNEALVLLSIGCTDSRELKLVGLGVGDSTVLPI